MSRLYSHRIGRCKYDPCCWNLLVMVIPYFFLFTVKIYYFTETNTCLWGYCCRGLFKQYPFTMLLLSPTFYFILLLFASFEMFSLSLWLLYFWFDVSLVVVSDSVLHRDIAFFRWTVWNSSKEPQFYAQLHYPSFQKISEWINKWFFFENRVGRMRFLYSQ